MLDVKILDIDISCGFSCYEKYLSLVSKERQEKIARFKFDKDKILSLFSGLLIQNEISRKLDIDEKKIQFSYNEHGKPFLRDFPDFHFSVSHSGNCVAFVCDSLPIGIDIEKIAPAKIEIAKRFFDINEYKYILRSENPNNTFYEIWTKKESYVKMLGTGLATPLSSFDVTDIKLCESFYTTQISEYMVSIYSKRIAQKIIPTIQKHYISQ